MLEGTLDRGLTIGEYAKQICKEIGWPYSGNLTLLSDCISSLAHLKGVDGWGGFISLMEAIRLARAQSVRIDRWFFQDGRYVELLKEAEAPISSGSVMFVRSNVASKPS